MSLTNTIVWLPEIPSALLLRLVCAVTVFWLVPAVLTGWFARRWSAALRYRLWSVSTAAVLALPVLISLLPQWRVAHFSPTSGSSLLPFTETKDEPARSKAVASAAVANPVAKSSLAASRSIEPDPAFDIPWALCAAVTWVVGFAWLTIRQLMAIAWAVRMRRCSRLIPEIDSAVVKLRQLAAKLNCRSSPSLQTSDEISSPMCVGLFRSSIILPADYSTWPAAQLDATLAHELAHAVRRDVLWQAMARFACAIYWFHPLSWFADRQMHAERELACDDYVLRSGQESTQYARLLVQLAEVIADLPRPAELAGVAMASRGRLEERVRAVLEPMRRRNPVSRLGTIVLSTTGIAILMIAATLDPITASELRADAATTLPAAILSPEVEQLLKDLAAQEAKLQNLTIRAQSWDELSPNEGKNDWQKDKPHQVLQAWFVGSPMRQGRVDMHDEVLTWINGIAPFSQQSYSVAFDGKVGKYIQFATGPAGQVNDLHRATLTATMPAVMQSLGPATGGSFSIYYYGQRGKGISSSLKGYFATLRAHDPAIPITVTSEKFQGAETLKLTIGTPAKATENYWFDTARGLALLAVRARATDFDGREVCSLEVHVTKLAEVAPKIWFPMEVDRYFGGWYPDPADTLLGKRRGKDTDPGRRRSRFVASECKANDPNFDPSIFSPGIPEGFSVNDEIAKSNYKAAKPRKVDPSLDQILHEKIGTN